MKKLKLITTFWGISIISSSFAINLKSNSTTSYASFNKQNDHIKKAKVENKTSFTTSTLKIKDDNPRFTLTNMVNILTNDLKKVNIVQEVNDNHNLLLENKKWYVINPDHNFSFIKIPVILEKIPQKNKKVYLIFDCMNFKLQGYQKVTKTNQVVYYHFNDATILDTGQTRNSDVGSLSTTEKYTFKLNISSKLKDLKFNSSAISWITITDSFSQLFNNNTNEIEKQINQYEAENIMLITLEALKFRNFEILVGNNNEPTTILLNNWKNYLLTELEHWGKSDEITEVVATLEKNQNLDNHILSDYKELILPANMFKYIKKNEQTNSYILELSEKIFYFDETKTNTTIKFTESRNSYQNYAIYEFNLNKINPLKINKIAFISDTNDKDWGVSINWGSTVIRNNPDLALNKIKNPNYIYLGTSIDQYLKAIDNNLQVILQNKKITHTSRWAEINTSANCVLQTLYRKEFLASICLLQKVGITWYYNEQEENYYLQVIIYQYLESFTSFSSVSSMIKLGNGIKLYQFDK